MPNPIEDGNKRIMADLQKIFTLPQFNPSSNINASALRDIITDILNLFEEIGSDIQSLKEQGSEYYREYGSDYMTNLRVKTQNISDKLIRLG